MEAPTPVQNRRLVRLAIVLIALVAAAVAGGWFALGGFQKSNQSRGLVGLVSPAPPTPSPTPPTLRGQLPRGQAAVLYQRRDESEPAGELLAAAWDGTLYSTNQTLVYQGSATQSPDGSKVLLGSIVFDVATRSQLADMPFGSDAYTELWGDDSLHICWIAAATSQSPEDVWIAAIGSPAVYLATLAPPMPPGIAGPPASVPALLACSPLAGVVVAAQAGQMGDTTDTWVLSATTGAVESHRMYPRTTRAGDDGVRVVASRDGSYLAEIDSVGGTSTIRRLSDGSVRAQLAGLEVHAFSWNGDQVLVTDRQPGLAIDNVSFENPAVIDLTSGEAIWQAPPGARWFEPDLVLQPGGSSLALGLNVCEPDCQTNLWLIGAGGKGRELDHNVTLLP